MEFYAPASPGTERALRDELCELRFERARLNRGGIPFAGDWEDGWRACLQSRIAQRIQVLMSTFAASSPEELYAGTDAVDWTPYLTPRHTLAVGSFCRSRHFAHSGFAALKVKDAIVDQIRRIYGERPSVHKEDPDVRIFVFVSERKVKLYLDLSGVPLHKRGYRRQTGDAPLRETLAAALLRLSGWDRTSPLADPMCGSGTIPIEAALWAGNVAPGIFRKTFGFERWACFSAKDHETMRMLRGDMRHSAHRQTPKVIAADCDDTVLRAAEVNARAAGVRLRFRHNSIQDLQLGERTQTLVFNPPYNERIRTATDDVNRVAATLSRMHNKRVCILSGNPEWEKAIPFRPVEQYEISNGNIDCSFLIYDVL